MEELLGYLFVGAWANGLLVTIIFALRVLLHVYLDDEDEKKESKQLDQEEKEND